MNPVPEYLNCILYPLVGKRMLELGNKKSGNDTYKAYFESIGIDHTSIDWNGLDGAQKLDLRQPIDLDPFDMVTNFGTTEHVSDQEGVWRNIHNLTKIGGVIVSLTPLRGDWWWHGQHYPEAEFFHAFAVNGYRIDYLDIGRKHPNRIILARMAKLAHNEFIMPPADTMYFNQVRPR